MKNILLLALTAFVIMGCYQAKAYHNKDIDLVGDYKIRTIEYQGCEYVIIDSYYHMRTVITHKGNCKFCKERRQKELKELIEQLNKL